MAQSPRWTLSQRSNAKAGAAAARPLRSAYPSISGASGGLGSLEVDLGRHAQEQVPVLLLV